MVPLVILAAGALVLMPDNAAFPKGLTCRVAADAEVQYGSEAKPGLEHSLSLGMGGAFHRTYRGNPASIIHLCNAGMLQARLIYVSFDSWHAAQLAFDAYRHSFDQQFGKPCGQPSPLDIERHGIEWKARRDLAVNLQMLPPSNSTPQIVISSFNFRITEPAKPSSDAVRVQLTTPSRCKGK
jgi:hypothetical protein